MSKGILIKEVYEKHPPIFVAMCLKTYVVTQGDSFKEAKKNLYAMCKVTRVFGLTKRKPHKSYFEYAKRNPDMCFYITKKKMNHWKVSHE